MHVVKGDRSVKKIQLNMRRNWTNLFEQMVNLPKTICPKYWLAQKSIEQNTNWTDCNSPNVDYTIFSLNRFGLTKKHIEQCELNMILFNWPLYNFKKDVYHNGKIGTPWVDGFYRVRTKDLGFVYLLLKYCSICLYLLGQVKIMAEWEENHGHNVQKTVSELMPNTVGWASSFSP